MSAFKNDKHQLILNYSNVFGVYIFMAFGILDPPVLAETAQRIDRNRIYKA